ncbi:putative transcription factor C2C2-CO-like family [Helianthus annuus]|uniref:Putative activator of spomin::LUC2 n=1 Tax=Helianthus annuus TaxID=4232 RepID=A0A251T9P4_HELAN|nr:two-component response regulator-like APRR9 [Helianthus annuus]KAF5781419.1 putative transcription factor C2C2-CO-like family [Helianthus annuus]KAJ0501031.1 putative transcription factor C2C2-CO-like family [Helianthus annuus]KAJ0508713.1 putative transcription factor C2C2-CO-like family [Helianthus annuus]KAJ0516920.1 putative transcription factor C2C2-CO-like family [Helianthus annuus]KAJ0684930.1 putative transcription factor C2C2-CO-like family [Helianthus annuus]
MSFISKVHSFSGDLQTPPSTTLPMWYDDTTSSGYFDKYGITMPPEYDISTTPLSRSSSWKTSFPERFGVSEMVVPTSPTGFSSIPVEADYQKVEHDDYFCSSGGYGTNSWSTYNPTAATTNWETESPKTIKEVEEPALKIGRYSAEERKDKIMRYLKKRNQRNFNKTIKYECRKTLADKRIRVRGRFAKNNNEHHHHHHNDHQPCEDQVLPSNNTANNPSEEEIQHLYTNSFLMKQDYDEEEEWLQEAMASLLY